MDKRTMKAFDEMCLTPVEELTAEQIRLREKASQAVFARYLNVTTGLVSQGARRKTPARRVVQTADARRQEGVAGRSIVAATRKHDTEHLVSGSGSLGRTRGWRFLRWRKEQVGRNMETGS